MGISDTPTIGASNSISINLMAVITKLRVGVFVALIAL